MIVPFILSISREVLLAVPVEQREAALAVGATRWEATWKVVVPCARAGIVGSVFLALARALGETMAVTMVI
jgi:phosphate transport system permease protein